MRNGDERVSAARRRLLAAMAVGAAGIPAAAQAAAPLVSVYKSPDCGCCGDWVAHLERNGFRVEVHALDVIGAARDAMPERYRSCHAARVDGYLLEGHVPARELTRLLKERPAAIGLAVPGMPVGSPGMDGGPYGSRRDPYDVLLVQRGGGSQVFESYR